MPLPGYDARGPSRGGSSSRRMLNVLLPPWQRPSSASVPPQGAPGGSGWRGAPRRETGPLGAQPLPQVLEPAASKAAYFSRLCSPLSTIAGSSSSSLEGGPPLPRRIGGGVGGSPQCSNPVGPSPLDMVRPPSL